MYHNSWDVNQERDEGGKEEKGKELTERES
jgi:hypothetical protein